MRFLLILAIMASWSVLSLPLHEQAKNILAEGADSLLAVMENATVQEKVLGPGTSLDPMNEIDQENDLNQDNDFDSKKNFDHEKDFNYTEEENDTLINSEDDVMTALGPSETNSSTVPDEPTGFTATASEEENDTLINSEDDVMTALGPSETNSSTVPDEPTGFTATASEHTHNSQSTATLPTQTTERDGQEAKTVIQFFIQIISPEVSRRYRPLAQHEHASPGSSGQEQEITGPQSPGNPYEELGGEWSTMGKGQPEKAPSLGVSHRWLSDMLSRGLFWFQRPSHVHQPFGFGPRCSLSTGPFSFDGSHRAYLLDHAGGAVSPWNGGFNAQELEDRPQNTNHGNEAPELSGESYSPRRGGVEDRNEGSSNHHGSGTDLGSSVIDFAFNGRQLSVDHVGRPSDVESSEEGYENDKNHLGSSRHRRFLPGRDEIDKLWQELTEQADDARVRNTADSDEAEIVNKPNGIYSW